MGGPYQPQDPYQDGYPGQGQQSGQPYPGQGQPYPGPGQYGQPGQGGYPGPAQPGQHGQPPPGGYPGQGQPAPGGYPGPPRPAPGGYPGQGQQGYPPQGQPAPGYQQGYPGQHDYPQQAPQGGESAIAIDFKYYPLALAFMFIKPKIVINGYEMEAPWGRQVYPVPAGQHHVHIYVPYFFPPRIGPAELTIPVHPGQTVELEYRAPFWAWAPGAFGTAPQPWNGVGITIGLIVAPLALVFLLFFFAIIASAA